MEVEVVDRVALDAFHMDYLMRCTWTTYGKHESITIPPRPVRLTTAEPRWLLSPHMSDEKKVGKTCRRCGAVVRLRRADAGSLADPNARTAAYASCRCDSIDGPDVD